MAQIIQECITIRLSRVVRSDDNDVNDVVTDDVVNLIDAALQEVLELPAGTVVEVERNEG